jgi:hypothetical protein
MKLTMILLKKKKKKKSYDFMVYEKNGKYYKKNTNNKSGHDYMIYEQILVSILLETAVFTINNFIEFK